MRNIFAFFFIVCMSHTAWGDPQPVTREEVPFKVDIAINEDSLTTDFYKKVGRFYIETKITNISTTDQEMIVWTQQGWSWTSDNAEVTPGKSALNNFPTHITLKPNEEYTGRVEMFSDPKKTRPVTFRLGFFPKAGPRPISAWTDREKSEGFIWSNPVRLTQ